MKENLTLRNWSFAKTYDGRIQAFGAVYGHTRHDLRDGMNIHTSPVVSVSGRGNQLTVETCSGSLYHLLLTQMDMRHARESYECAKKWLSGDRMRSRWRSFFKVQDEICGKAPEEREKIFLQKIRDFLGKAKESTLTGEDVVSAVDELTVEEGLVEWRWKDPNSWKRFLPLLRGQSELISFFFGRFLEEMQIPEPGGWKQGQEGWHGVFLTELFQLCRGEKELYRLWYETYLLRFSGFSEEYRETVRERRPGWYTDEDFFRLLLERSRFGEYVVEPEPEIYSSWYYLFQTARAMGRKLQVNRKGKYSGVFLHDYLTGEWQNREDPDDLEAGLTIHMEAMQISGECAEEMKDGFPAEDHAAVDRNEPEFFLLCWRNGLLRERYLEQYLEYAFEQKRFAVIPAIVSLKWKGEQESGS